MVMKDADVDAAVEISLSKLDNKPIFRPRVELISEEKKPKAFLCSCLDLDSDPRA